MNQSKNNTELHFDALPDILTVQQTRAVQGIGRTAVYRLLESGKIRCFQIGNAYKIPKASVLEFIQASCDRKGGV